MKKEKISLYSETGAMMLLFAFCLFAFDRTRKRCICLIDETERQREVSSCKYIVCPKRVAKLLKLKSKTAIRIPLFILVHMYLSFSNLVMMIAFVIIIIACQLNLEDIKSLFFVEAVNALLAIVISLFPYYRWRIAVRKQNKS